MIEVLKLPMLTLGKTYVIWKHLFQVSQEHKISSHGHMLVETTTIAYAISKNYVWILSHYHELINLEMDHCCT